MGAELENVYNENFNTSDVNNESSMSAQIDKIAAALSKAQSELTAATKDQSGYGYNYSDLNDVINTAKPFLAKNGLCVTQLLGNTDDVVRITTILAHTSGQYFKSEASLPVIEMKGCNKAQGAGASASYLRRYAYQAILGMASEDNDASSNGPKKEVKAPKKSSAPQPTEEPKAEVKAEDSFRRRKRSEGGRKL